MKHEMGKYGKREEIKERKGGRPWMYEGANQKRNDRLSKVMQSYYSYYSNLQCRDTFSSDILSKSKKSSKIEILK